MDRHSDGDSIQSKKAEKANVGCEEGELKIGHLKYLIFAWLYCDVEIQTESEEVRG